jgi:cytochrome c oxidase subunit 3
MAQTVAANTKWWSGGKSPFNVEYGKLMMWYFLMSDAFTFGAFLIAYGTVRVSSVSWPDPNFVFQSFPFLGNGLPLVFVSLMTFILIVSSVTMVLAVHEGHHGNKKGVVKWMIWTIIGGLAFLSCQAWEWNHLHHEGAWWGRNPFPNADGTVASSNFANFFFTIVTIMAWRGVFERRGHYLMIEKIGLYWHFVDLVWVFVFLFFYLV